MDRLIVFTPRIARIMSWMCAPVSGQRLRLSFRPVGAHLLGNMGRWCILAQRWAAWLRQMTGGVLTTDVFIGCGVAGAIAAGFNAPIAGLVFAHEAILRHFFMRAIAPIAIASISAVWFSDRLFDVAPLFSMDSSGFDMTQMLPSALVAGPVFGIVAVLFMLAIRSSCAFRGYVRLVVSKVIVYRCDYHRSSGDGGSRGAGAWYRTACACAGRRL